MIYCHIAFYLHLGSVVVVGAVVNVRAVSVTVAVVVDGTADLAEELIGGVETRKSLGVYMGLQSILGPFLESCLGPF